MNNFLHLALAVCFILTAGFFVAGCNGDRGSMEQPTAISSDARDVMEQPTTVCSGAGDSIEQPTTIDNSDKDPIEQPSPRSKDDHGNEPGSSSALTVSRVVNGELNSKGDTDFFRFKSEGGQSYQIEVDNRGSTFFRFTVYGPDGKTPESTKRVSGGDIPNQVQWVAPSSDNYYVAVSSALGNAGGFIRAYDQYKLLVTPYDDAALPNNAATFVGEGGTKLQLGKTIEESVAYPNETDLFSFTGREGYVYLIEVSPVFKNNDIEMALYDAGLNIAEGKTTSSLFSSVSRIRLAAPRSAVYSLTVRFRGAGIGPYTLTVKEIDTSLDDHGDDAKSATDISVGDLTQGCIELEADLDYFRFLAEGGQRYQMEVGHGTIQVSDSKGLYGQDGLTLQKWESRSGLKRTWVAPDSGHYYFAVRHAGVNSDALRQVGTYTVSITAINDN